MEKIKNAKRDLAVIVADLVKAENNKDTQFSKLITEALTHYSQRQLVTELEKVGIKLAQKQIQQYGAVGVAIKSVKGLDVDHVLKALRQGEIQVSEVKAWGKNAPSEYTKPRGEVKGRKTQGTTQVKSSFDTVKKSLDTAVKNAKNLTASEKSKLQDLALELVTILGILPEEDFDLALEMEKILKD